MMRKKLNENELLQLRKADLKFREIKYVHLKTFIEKLDWNVR